MSKKSRIRYCESPGCNKPFMIQKNHKTEKNCPLHREMLPKGIAGMGDEW